VLVTIVDPLVLAFLPDPTPLAVAVAAAVVAFEFVLEAS
jgi:hypothetical protein